MPDTPQVPRQLAVFADPAAATKRMNRDLAHVERRAWGAVATVPYRGTTWTTAAFIGDPARAARVALGHAERTLAGQPLGNYPIAALVSLGAVGLGSLFVPPTALVLLALLGFLLGLPLATLYRSLERGRVPSIELDDDLRLLLVDEQAGRLPSSTVGALLKAAGREREVVVAAAQRSHHLLELAQGCPPDMAVPATVASLLDDLAADPTAAWPVTAEALDELTEAVQQWRRAQEVLQTRADAPVRRLLRRDREADQRARRERARATIEQSLAQLRDDARARGEVADELE